MLLTGRSAATRLSGVWPGGGSCCTSLLLRTIAPSTSPRRRQHLRHVSSSASFQWKSMPEALVARAPVSTRPFLRVVRIDKPTGTFLLFWPGAWGICLATPAAHFPDGKTLVLFAAGSILMRGAACIINDLWDRKYDAQVERTRNRPLACGDMNTKQAVVLLGALLSSSLACLLQLNPLTIGIGLTAIIPAIAYPLAKRYTYYPQVALGLTINYSAIMGFTAVANQVIPEAIIPLYISTICWTVIYDTIYAHQDKDDDRKIGVLSTALKFGTQTQPYLAAFATTMLASLGTAGYVTGQTWPYYAALGATAGHLAWQISTLRMDDRHDCWRKFNSNQWVGALILLGLFAGTLCKSVSSSQRTPATTTSSFSPPATTQSSSNSSQFDLSSP